VKINRVVKIYWKFGSKYRSQFFTCLTIFCIAGVLELCGLLLLFPIVQQGGSKDPSIQTISFLALGLTLLLASGAKRLGERATFKLQNRIEVEERSLLLKRIIEIPWKKISGFDQAGLNTALISDVSQATAGIVAMLHFSVNFFMLSILFIATFVVNSLSTLLVLLLGGVSAIIVKGLKRRQSQIQQDLVTAYEKIDRESSSLIMNLKFLRVSGYSEEWVKTTSTIFNNIGKLSRATLDLPSIGRWVSESSGSITLIFVLFYFAVIENSVISGIVFVAIIYRTLPRIQVLQTSWMVLYQQSVWASRWNQRIDELLTFEMDYKLRDDHFLTPSFLVSNAEVPLIKLKDVGIRFDNRSNAALDGINLEIFQSEKIALVGASGSGKSTLIDIFTGLIKPDSGELFIAGQISSKVDFESWRKSISWVPQNSPVLQGTIQENIQWLNLGSNNARIEDVIEATNLSEFVKELKNGLFEELNPRNELSGGQVQRLALARAFIRQPIFMLLDESTAALDRETETLILESLEKLSCGFMIATHRLAPLRICDRVIEVTKGELTFDGKVQTYIESRAINMDW
jgi:ATP-binding cassette subfamily B protein AbcA/BmrA